MIGGFPGGGGGGCEIGTTAPTNVKMLWIDTSGSKAILKYYNGTAWVPTAAVWG